MIDAKVNSKEILVKASHKGTPGSFSGPEPFFSSLYIQVYTKVGREASQFFVSSTDAVKRETGRTQGIHTLEEEKATLANTCLLHSGLPPANLLPLPPYITSPRAIRETFLHHLPNSDHLICYIIYPSYITL
jgi:hypothetical protein